MGGLPITGAGCGADCGSSCGADCASREALRGSTALTPSTSNCGHAVPPPARQGSAGGRAVRLTPQLLGSAVSSRSAASRTLPWQSPRVRAQVSLSTPVKAQSRSTAARLGTAGPSEGARDV